MRRRSDGFTLLEVMVAIAILAVSLLALFHLQGTSLLGAGRAQRISIATLLARQKMAETLIGIEAGIPKGEFPDKKDESGNFEEEKYSDYRWKLAIKKTTLPAPPAKEGEPDTMAQIVSSVSEEISKDVREVRLTVSWKEFEEEEVGIVLTTHVVKIQ